MRHRTGWSPRAAQRAAQRTAYARTGFRADAPTPAAISLTEHRRRILAQGGVGVCWVHSAIRLAETVLIAEGVYEYAELCRCLVGYEGKKLEGGGNPDDGGSATDALTAMRAAPDGIGACHEDSWPYLPGDLFDQSMQTDAGEKAARAYVGGEPPDEALKDVGFYLAEVAVVESDAIARVNIAHGYGNATGHAWPESLDDKSRAQDGCLFTDFDEPDPADGHSLYECGYVKRGVWPGVLGQSDWWQIDNWHGEIYAPLPDELAALVPGYVPTSVDATTDFWISGMAYRRLIHAQYAERVTACGSTGWGKLGRWASEQVIA